MTEPRSKKSFLDRETWLIILAVLGGIFVTLSMTMFSGRPVSKNPSIEGQGPGLEKSGAAQPHKTGDPKVALANIPLATGEEPIPKLFIQSGCAACHTIPGILAAKGREGPRLVLETNGPKRLADPNYHGKATTVHEYIMESILEPGAYVVPGYPDRVMPRWYGKKLSAGALDKMVAYLERVAE
ncbi:MAG: c-type cytochrome [Nitrospirales bacterium]|nr:c-type cytochrome [Nitrospira sp.]MDR4499953.1 c-type cytochrome [Nitrospirales bacterium]